MKEYNPNKAIAYARKYAIDYNTYYKNFNNSGGDCTNYISQCLHAGNLPLTNTWKPYTAAWIQVKYLYEYLIKDKIGKVSIDMPLKEGNIIQFYSEKKLAYSHSVIITKVLPNNNCLICSHFYDRLDTPLSELYPAIYKKIRYIDIFK